jgi:hypothetical protein
MHLLLYPRILHLIYREENDFTIKEVVFQIYITSIQLCDRKSITWKEMKDLLTYLIMTEVQIFLAFYGPCDTMLYPNSTYHQKNNNIFWLARLSEIINSTNQRNGYNII